MISITFDPPTGVAAVDIATVSRFILMLSSTTAAFLPLLSFAPHHFPAPAVAISSSYHALTVSVIFAFAFSFSAVFLESKPPAARILRLTAVAWQSSAVLLFLYTVVFRRLV